MAIVNQVTKQVRVDSWDVVKYQLLTHCFLKRIAMSNADLDCLTLLALEGQAELSGFCNKAFQQKIFSSAQSVRNCLNRAEKEALIIKEGKNRKKIYVNPIINIHTKGNILLDFKFLSVETNQS